MSTKDLVTTIVGGIGAAAGAAGPALQGMDGNMQSGDWLQLIMAVAFAVVSWYTGKENK